MIVTLKMNIQDQDFTLEVDLTNKAGRIYRQQFGRDLLKDMRELYQKLNRSIFDGIDMSKIQIIGKTEQEIYEQIIANADVSRLLTAQTDQEPLDFEETEKAGQIIWAFAKNRDENIPNYEEWIDDYDFILPVDKIVTALYNAWAKTAQPIVELKN